MHIRIYALTYGLYLFSVEMYPRIYTYQNEILSLWPNLNNGFKKNCFHQILPFLINF